jgi:uncharacterized protein YkwD
MDALTMSAQARAAARLHSFDMSYSGYFDHASCNGRSPADRAAAVGVSGSEECLAAAYESPEPVVEAWMSSPPHCAMLMASSISQVGVGHAPEGGYWTVFFHASAAAP